MNENPLLKLWQIIRNPSHSRTLGILAILVMVAAIPLTVYIAQQRQEVRQRAAANCTGSLTYTCAVYPNHKLTATWSVPEFYGPNTCNVYIQAEQTSYLLTNACGNGSWSDTKLPNNGPAINDDGHYQLVVSNGAVGADGCSGGSDPNKMVADVILPCKVDLSVTNLSASPNPVKTSTQTTIKATGTGSSIKVYVHGSTPSASDQSGGNYSSTTDILSGKYYLIGSINPASPTDLNITSPAKAGKYFLTAIAFNATNDTVCSWDQIKYKISGGQKQNIGSCPNKGPVSLSVGTSTGMPWVGGKVTNSKDNTKGIKDVEIQVFNNDAPGTGSAKIKKVLTDASGDWHVEDFVDWGNTYAVWVTGNLANPKTAPSGFSPPAKTTTLGWTWDNCAKNSQGGVEEGDTLVGSLSYECQKAEQTNRKDCSGPDGSGNQNTTLRCNFAYDPAPFPDAKIQFENTDLKVRSKNVSAGQTIGFKATLHANQGTLSLGEIWVAKKDGSNATFCPDQTKVVNNKWCGLKSQTFTDSSITATLSASWQTKTSTAEGEYWAVVNAKDNVGGKCSGNPLDPLPAGWGRCDPNDLDRLAVVIGPASSISPTATQPPPSGTQPPSATPTTSPTPSPTLTVGGTQLAFELILQGVGPEGGNRNPKKSTRQLRVQLFDVNNKEAVNKQGDITFDPQDGKFKGIVDLGILSPVTIMNLREGEGERGSSFPGWGNATPTWAFRPTSGNELSPTPAPTSVSGSSFINKFVIKVKTKRYLRKIIDAVSTLNLGALNRMPLTTLIAGDINDDNTLDIKDYNILVGCFTDKINTASCTDPENSDLDDNGIVDGIDLNLFLRSLSVQEGD